VGVLASLASTRTIGPFAGCVKPARARYTGAQLRIST
jgi:hypothetical protein